MKKRLSCFFLALALTGCHDSSQPVKPESMNAGRVRFAANLVLEDIIRRGAISPYFLLSPSNALNPYQMLDANSMIEDFRRDFARAENWHYRLRDTGMTVRGTVAHVDKNKYEIAFIKEETTDKLAFSGTLRVTLDKDFYVRAGQLPYEAGAVGTFMCKEFRPVHDFRNEAIHKVEIRLTQCKAADDYYAAFRDRIQERLMDIFTGKETVSSDLAKRLAALYMAGKSIPEDSVCFSGGFLACHESLADELVRKWDNVKIENVGTMRIDPEKSAPRKLEQIQSGPAVRPENAGQSPSGKKLNESSLPAQEQKEIVSRVKPSPTK